MQARTLLYSGLVHAGLTSAALSFALTPFLVVLIEAFIGRSTVNWRAACLTLACFAAVFQSQSQDLSHGTVSAGGLVLLAASAVSFAGYSVGLRHLALSIPSAPSFFVQVLLCIPIQFGLVLLTAPEFRPLDMAGPQWLAVGYLGVFASAIAFWLWSRHLRALTTEQASALLALVPVLAGVFGALFLGEDEPDKKLFLLLFAALSAAVLSNVHSGRIRGRARGPRRSEPHGGR